MKNAIILCLCLLLFFSCNTESVLDKEPEEPTQVMNLLKNGNCERWSTLLSGNKYYLDGWSLKDNKESVFREKGVVYEGQYAAKLCTPKSGITAFIGQSIYVHPGHRLRLFFRYYLEEGSENNARTYCYFGETASSNIPIDVLNTFYDSETLKIIRGGGYGLSTFPKETGVWKTFDYTIQVPAIAYNFVFEIRSYFGTTLYVDDCYVIDLDF